MPPLGPAPRRLRTGLAVLTLAGGVLLARPVAAAPPDTTAAPRYFPLAVGNVWEYGGTSQSPAEFATVTERHHVLSGVDGQPGHFVVETFRRRQWGPNPGQISTSTATAVWHFDAATSRVIGGGTPTPCLDAPFGEVDVCGERAYTVSGGYGQTVSVGASSLVTSAKTFVYNPTIPTGFYGEEARFAAGLGRTFFSSVQQTGPDQYRTESTLRYAFVGGVAYGTAQFPVAAEDAPDGAALALRLGPNPARGAAEVRFSLDAPCSVRLAVYDALGREVAVLAEGPRGAGPHEVALDAGRLAPGAYVLRLEAGARSVTRRVSVAR
jgi:hypothetical protein